MFQCHLSLDALFQLQPRRPSVMERDTRIITVHPMPRFTYIYGSIPTRRMKYTVCFPVLSLPSSCACPSVIGLYHVSKCILNVQTPLCPGQSTIILIAV